MFELSNFSFQSSLAGIIPFISYLAVAIVAIGIFIFVYTLVTPHSEMKLIKANNEAAGISFGGAVLGFVYPLTVAMKVSDSIYDFMVWAVIAMVVQIVLFLAIRIPFPRLILRIEAGEKSVALMLASLSIAFGLVNGTCMI